MSLSKVNSVRQLPFLVYILLLLECTVLLQLYKKILKRHNNNINKNDDEDEKPDTTTKCLVERAKIHYDWYMFFENINATDNGKEVEGF